METTNCPLSPFPILSGSWGSGTFFHQIKVHDPGIPRDPDDFAFSRGFW